MLNNEEKDLCITVAKVLRVSMNHLICEDNFIAAERMGKTLDDFLKFVNKLESKDD